MMFLKLMLIAIVLIALAGAAIAIRMFIKRNGEFTKSCSTIDPKTGKPLSCTCHNDNVKVCDNE